MIQLFRGEVNLYKWDGTDFTRRFGDPPATTLIYSVGERRQHQDQRDRARQHEASAVLRGRDLRNRLQRDDRRARLHELRRPTSPPTSARGFFTYDVKVAPTRVVFKSLKTAPRRPRPGKTFTVRMAATRSDTGAAIVNGRVDCTAKAGARTRAAERRSGSSAARRCASSRFRPTRLGQDAARDDQDRLRGQDACRGRSAAKIR